MTVLRRQGAGRSGWWVVLSGSVLLTLQNGLIMAAFGAYLVAITTETGWSPGVIAIGYAIVQLGNGFIAPLTGWCCDRFGTRAVSRAGTLVTALGFGVGGIAVDEGQFLAAVVVIALGCSAAGIMPLTVAVVQVLPERRTLALGLLPSGVALGGLAVPLVVLALEGLGWRVTFLGIAAVTVAVGLAASAVLPSEPVEAPVVPAPAPDERAAVRPADEDHDLRAAVRTAAFWLLVVGHGAALVAVSAINLHLVPLLTRHHGMSLGTAGLAVAAMSVAQLVGQVVTGVIGDRIDKRHLAAGCMLVQSAVLLVMATASGFGVLVTAAVVHGLAWGLRGPAMTAMRTDYFGLTSFGTIMGWSMGFVSLGLVLGPLLVTAVEAGPGGYPLALVLLAAVTGVGMAAFLGLRPPAFRVGRPRGGRDAPDRCATG
ncbi:MFS transporter [Pseudonocardia petroleophila]|uniref:MFS transporter n=1 Tax=Pseudonocardia petroleophila TaxID=37331 RepID=A0A7G7MCS0_9PSEU|nr:MFS transporter [Pseudonocardia petroleophila]QNG50581.1 MFS transporter [Pseudonocardia petroleophila]